MMRSYWFGDVYAWGCTRAEGGLDALVERLNSIKVSPGDILPPDWRTARECGAVKNRAEYLGARHHVHERDPWDPHRRRSPQPRQDPGPGAPMVSIGGAGTFDGIFLAGVIAAFLAEKRK